MIWWKKNWQHQENYNKSKPVYLFCEFIAQICDKLRVLLLLLLVLLDFMLLFVVSFSKPIPFHNFFFFTRLHAHRKDFYLHEHRDKRESSMRKKTRLNVVVISCAYYERSHNCHWMETLRYANIPNRLACIMVVTIAI